MIGGVYWYLNVTDTTGSVPLPNDGVLATTSALEVITGDVVAETTTGEKITGVDTSKLPSAPSLTRKVLYAESVMPAVKTSLEQKIAAVTADLKSNPTSLENWINLGVYYKQAGDYAGAAAAWEYASLLSPGNVVSFNNLGDLYHYYLKDYPKAEKNFLRAIQNDPKYLLSYFNTHDLYRLSYEKQTTKAADILKRALVVVPDNFDLTNALAAYYRDSADSVNARVYYEKAIAIAKKAGATDQVTLLQSELNALK